MRVIAADSAAAILDKNFTQLSLIASVSVLVEPPYREAHIRLAEPIFMNVEEGHDVIVHEAELCLNLLEEVKADVVHLDTSLGGLLVEELSPVHLSNMKLSAWARQNLLKMLPKLRKIACEIKRKHGIDMLAIGKESIPVRIAELTAGSEAIIYACEKALKTKESLLLGLPVKCQHRVTDGRVYLHSLIAEEFDVRGYAEDANNVLKQVNIAEMLNPVARGFRALKITPKP